MNGGGGDDDDEAEDGEEEWEEVPEGILDAAPMREEGDEEARLRCGLVMEATGCLLRLRRECEYAPTQYHELIQALHLRAAGEIDDTAAVARARRTQQGRPAALRLIRRFSSPPRLAALVAASRALHGAAPLTTELIDKIQRCLHHSTEIRRAALGGPSEAAAGADAEADDDGDDGVPLKAEPAEARQILGPGSFVQNAREAREAEVEGGRLPAIWPLAMPTDDGDTAAAAAAKEEEEDGEGERSGMQPPLSWGYKRPAEGGAAPPRVNLAAAPLSVHAEHTELLQDTTMYHLTAVAHAAGAGVTVHWSYPPGTPGTSGAWVTLCEAVRERWRHVACRVRYKLICRDHVAGSLSFTASDFRKVRRGRYVFAMHCEDDLLATSQVVVLGGGEPAVVEALRGESTVADGELLEHKPPPASEAAADLAAAAAAAAAEAAEPAAAEAEMEVEAADAEAAEAEGRACFPVPLVDVQVLGDSAHAGLLRRAYTVIDRASYLNWGLTSDYDGAGVATQYRGGAAGGGRAGVGGGDRGRRGRWRRAARRRDRARGAPGYVVVVVHERTRHPGAARRRRRTRGEEARDR